MKIIKLWKVDDYLLVIEPIYGDAEKLCRLLKEHGYWISKTDANIELKQKINNKVFINKTNYEKGNN
ncbi:MAG: hypothetical protein ACOYOV_17495 [Bacteroidales bacterium]